MNGYIGAQWGLSESIQGQFLVSYPLQIQLEEPTGYQFNYSNSASILQAWESLIDMMEKGKINLYLALDIERTKAEEEKEEKETEQNPKLSSISKLSYFILLLSPPLPGRAAGTKANLRGSLLFLPNIFNFFNLNNKTKVKSLYTQIPYYNYLNKMNFKPSSCLGFLFLALALHAMVAEASSIHDLGFHGTFHVGDLIGVDNEMLLDSEAHRRTLAGQGRYISYGSLNANQVPCGQRGNSYYNCQQRGRANPYNRGCSALTNCARQTN